MADGLLFVLSEPGEVPEEQFHEWYDGEHTPARTALPGIHTGDRFRAADGERPTWLAVPGDLRELAILRVATLNGAAYEWAAHEPVARREGLGDADFAAIRGGDAAALDERRGLVLELTDAMTRDVEVPQELFDALAPHFDDRGIVELTATIGAYNFVSRFIVALELTPRCSTRSPRGRTRCAASR